MNNLKDSLKSGLLRDLIDAGKSIRTSVSKISPAESKKFRDTAIDVTDVEVIKETGSRVDRKVDNLGTMIAGLSSQINNLQNTPTITTEVPTQRSTVSNLPDNNSNKGFSFGKDGLKGLIGNIVGKVKDTTGRSAIQSVAPGLARKTDKETEIYRTDVLWQLNQINSSLVKISKKVGAGGGEKSLMENAIDGLMDMASDFFDFDGPDRDKKKNKNNKRQRRTKRGKPRAGKRPASRNVSRTPATQTAPRPAPAPSPSPTPSPRSATPALPESATSNVSKAGQKATSSVAQTTGKSTIKNVAKTAGSAVKSGVKTGLKAAGKFAAKAAGKFIPGVGLAMGAADAWDRAKSGDWIGAGISGLSGLVSTVPVVGGAVSTVLDGVNAVKDFFFGGSDKKENKGGGLKQTLVKGALGAAAVGGVALASKAAGAHIDSKNKEANTPVKMSNGLMSVIPAPEGIEDDIPELRDRYREAVADSQPAEGDNEETKKRREKSRQKAEELKASIEKHDKRVLAEKGKTVDSVKDSNTGSDKPAGQDATQTDKKPDGEKKESGFFGKMAKGLFNLTPVGMAVNAVSSIFGNGSDKEKETPKDKEGEKSGGFFSSLAKKAFGLTPIGAAVNAVSALTGSDKSIPEETKTEADKPSVSTTVSETAKKPESQETPIPDKKDAKSDSEKDKSKEGQEAQKDKTEDKTKKPEASKESGSLFGKIAKTAFGATPIGMAYNAITGLSKNPSVTDTLSGIGGVGKTLLKGASMLTPVGLLTKGVSSLFGSKKEEEKKGENKKDGVSQVAEETKKEATSESNTPQTENILPAEATAVAKELEATAKQEKKEESDKQKEAEKPAIKGSATGKVQERSVGKKILDGVLSATPFGIASRLFGGKDLIEKQSDLLGKVGKGVLSATPFGMAYNGISSLLSDKKEAGKEGSQEKNVNQTLPQGHKKTVSKVMPDGTVKSVEKTEPSYPMGVKADDYDDGKSIKSGLEDVVDEISATSKKQIKTDEEISKKDIDTQEKLSERSTNALGSLFSAAFPGVSAAWNGLKKAWNWITGGDEKKPEVKTPENPDLKLPDSKPMSEGQSDIRSGIEELSDTIKRTGKEQIESDIELSKKERTDIEDFEEDNDKSFFRNLKKTLLDVFEEFFGDGEKTGEKKGEAGSGNKAGGDNAPSGGGFSGGGDASQGNISTYEGLGDIMSKYETGGKGTAQITNSAGDSGGASYGKAQLSYTKGSLKEFVNSLKDKNPEMYQRLSGAWDSAGQGAKGEFGQIWTKLSTDADFRKYESEFIGNQYLTGGLKNIKSDELKQKIQSNPAIQEMFLSTCIQHGPSGGPSIFNKVYQPGMSDEDFIRAVYGERGRTDSSGTLVHFSKNSANIQRGVANRFKNEVNDILALNQKGASGQVAMNAPSGGVSQGMGGSPAPSMPSIPTSGGVSQAPSGGSPSYENTEQFNDDNASPAEQQQAQQSVGVASKESLTLQSGVNFDDLNPVLKQRFGAMADEYKQMFGEKITVTSGKRTMEQQAKLRAEKGNNAARPNPLAPHISGLGLDASSAQMNKADDSGLLKKHGLWRPIKNGLGRTKPEAWHVEVEGSRDPNTKVITEQTLASFGGSTGEGTITASAPSGDSGMSTSGGGYSGGGSSPTGGSSVAGASSSGGNSGGVTGQSGGASRPQKSVGVFQAMLGGGGSNPLGSLAGGVLDSILGTKPQYERDTSDGMPPLEGQGVAGQSPMGGGLLGMMDNLIGGLFGMNSMGQSDVRGGTGLLAGKTPNIQNQGMIPEKESFNLNKKMGEPQSTAMNTDTSGNSGQSVIPQEGNNGGNGQPVVIQTNTTNNSSTVAAGGSTPRRTVIDDPTLILLNSQILG